MGAKKVDDSVGEERCVNKKAPVWGLVSGLEVCLCVLVVDVALDVVLA